MIKDSIKLLTDWETNPQLSSYTKEKYRILEEEFLRKRYNKQDYNLKPNTFERNFSYLLFKDTCYKIEGEGDGFYIVVRNGETSKINKDEVQKIF